MWLVVIFAGLLQYNHVNWAIIITTLGSVFKNYVVTKYLGFGNYIYFIWILSFVSLLGNVNSLYWAVGVSWATKISKFYFFALSLLQVLTYFDSKSLDIISNTVHKSYFLLVSNFSYHLKVVLSLINNKKKEMNS